VGAAGVYILGLNIGHDSSAVLVKDNEILAAASEERFTRIKHYAGLPFESTAFCLRKAGIEFEDVDVIAVPSVQLSPNHDLFLGLKGKYSRFSVDMPGASSSRKLRYTLSKIFWRLVGLPETTPPTYIRMYQAADKQIIRVDHHLSHAASAYYTSGFDEKTLVVTSDGWGDYVSTCAYVAEDGRLEPVMNASPAGSLGYFYAAVTEALGWWVSDGEGKVMGLAAYGKPDTVTDGVLEPLLPQFVNGELKRGHNFGLPSSFAIKDAYHFHFGDSTYVLDALAKYKREDVAARAQRLLEDAMVDIVSAWMKRTGARNLAAAGGVFLNVRMNQRIAQRCRPEQFHIFPNAGDATLGAALYGYVKVSGERKPIQMNNVYWGPEYSDDEIEQVLRSRNLKYERRADIAGTCADLLADGKILGWFQGRMEFGPRALGARSILVDPRKKENADIVNNRVKFREPWRPFCPSMLRESIDEYLVDPCEAPYMIMSFEVPPEKQGEIAGVVHVDGTTRPQTVRRDVNPLYWTLIKEFEKRTSVPMILNTSFNVRGDPIICSPSDAIMCFYNTGMDFLALGSFLIQK
jgi:carbamoyltransferase